MIKRLYKRLAVWLIFVLMLSTLLVSGCLNVEHVENYPNKPPASYFAGNVFQIITYDLDEYAVSTGTGCVFNDKGWFFTNAHVMDEAYYADAVFNIADEEEGESFTTLAIEYGAYMDDAKDLFIGKLTGYDKLKKYYTEFTLQEEYGVGDITYSVGYPNSSVSIQVSGGKVLGTVSSLYDKVTGGVAYIETSSYCAPGSSGGILVNENLEILGITSQIYVDKKTEEWVSSLAICAFNFKTQLKRINESNLVTLHELVHPNGLEFIRFFESIKYHPDVIIYKEGGDVFYDFKYTDEGTTDGGVNYSYEQYEEYTSTGYILYEDYLYWETGEKRECVLWGNYSVDNKLDGFHFNFRYEYADGDAYEIECHRTNYSTVLSLTLKNWQTAEDSRTPTSSELQYCRQTFNNICEYVFGLFEAANKI